MSRIVCGRFLLDLMPGARAVALVIALGLLAGCGAPPSPSSSPRPVVILISIDSLRADHLGAYGYSRKTSPEIDRLAETGVLFERATASSSWTLPSHAALFTGVSDSIHGVVDATLTLGPVLPTLAERFQEAGFATGGVVSGPLLHPGFGLDRGFDDYINCMGFLDEKFRSREGGQIRLREMIDASHSDVTSPCVLEESKRWLESHSSEPAFLFLHFWDVHYDYLPPPPFDTLFDADYDGSLDVTDFEHNPDLNPEMPHRDLEHLKALYDGEIAYVDHMIGRLLEFLERDGITDRLLLVVTSDHGEAFFEHGEKGHKNDLHVEVIRVPLILWGEGLPEGERIDAPVNLIDLMPTLLELTLGSHSGSPARGRGRVILGPGAGIDADRWVVSENCTGHLDELAIETVDRKLILDRNTGTAVTYDLVTDPGETRPRKPTGNELRQLGRTLRDLREASREGTAVPIRGMSSELRKRLRALGYVE